MLNEVVPKNMSSAANIVDPRTIIDDSGVLYLGRFLYLDILAGTSNLCIDMFFGTTSFSMLPDFAALKGYAGTMLVITEIFLNPLAEQLGLAIRVDRQHRHHVFRHHVDRRHAV